MTASVSWMVSETKRSVLPDVLVAMIWAAGARVEGFAASCWSAYEEGGSTSEVCVCFVCVWTHQ